MYFPQMSTQILFLYSPVAERGEGNVIHPRYERLVVMCIYLHPSPIAEGDVIHPGDSITPVTDKMR